MEIKPEPISYPFSVYDAAGNLEYRDALTFATPADFRETSEAERDAMRQERYNNWKELISNPPQEQTEPEVGE